MAAARVVVLPEPVGPVTRTRPRGRMIRSLSTGGVPRSSKLKSLLGICRRTMPTKPFCLKIETRKRARSPKAKPKSAPPFSCSSFCDRSGAMLFIRATVSSGSRTLVSSRFMWPSQPQHGRLPDGDVQVARLALDDRVQQFVDENRAHSQYLRRMSRPKSSIQRWAELPRHAEACCLEGCEADRSIQVVPPVATPYANRIEKPVVLGVSLPLALSVTIIRNSCKKAKPKTAKLSVGLGIVVAGLAIAAIGVQDRLSWNRANEGQ